MSNELIKFELVDNFTPGVDRARAALRELARVWAEAERGRLDWSTYINRFGMPSGRPRTKYWARREEYWRRKWNKRRRG